MIKEKIKNYKNLNLDQFISNKNNLESVEIYNEIINDLLDIITSCNYNRNTNCYDIYSYEYIHILCDSIESHHVFYISNEIRDEALHNNTTSIIRKAFKNQFNTSLIDYVESIA